MQEEEGRGGDGSIKVILKAPTIQIEPEEEKKEAVVLTSEERT